MDAGLAAAFEASWPAAEQARAGGFLVGRGLGGGGRVSSARVVGLWRAEDIDEAARIHAGWDQPPMFRVSDRDQALIEELDQRGYAREIPTAILQIDCARLTDRPIPPVTTFCVWPPMAIQREIWTAGGIGPERQAVMARVAVPRTAILGRIDDRAAAAAFVAAHAGVAMIHALEVVPARRRQGLAGWVLRQAAHWAVENGAGRLGLAVSRANTTARALYDRLGFLEAEGYAYYVRR